MLTHLRLGGRPFGYQGAYTTCLIFAAWNAARRSSVNEDSQARSSVRSGPTERNPPHIWRCSDWRRSQLVSVLRRPGRLWRQGADCSWLRLRALGQSMSGMQCSLFWSAAAGLTTLSRACDLRSPMDLAVLIGVAALLMPWPWKNSARLRQRLRRYRPAPPSPDHACSRRPRPCASSGPQSLR